MSVFLPTADVAAETVQSSLGACCQATATLNVDAEQADEDGCGDLGGELDKAVERAGPGVDADLVETFGKAVGTDGLAGAPAQVAARVRCHVAYSGVMAWWIQRSSSARCLSRAEGRRWRPGWCAGAEGPAV